MSKAVLCSRRFPDERRQIQVMLELPEGWVACAEGDPRYPVMYPRRRWHKLAEQFCLFEPGPHSD